MAGLCSLWDPVSDVLSGVWHAVATGRRTGMPALWVGDPTGASLTRERNDLPGLVKPLPKTDDPLDLGIS